MQFTIICILLYLGAMFSPNSYWDYEYDALKDANQTSIDNILADTQTTIQIETDYGTAATDVDIWNWEEN